MDEHFDDPSLKAAVGRVWGTDAAPDSLRSKIETLLNEHTAFTQAPVTAHRAGGRWRGFAIAASILLAAGIVTALPWGGTIAAAEAPLPRDVVFDMVKTHDRCCHARDHHLLRGVGRNDFLAIGLKLSGDLHVPVLSTPLEHWEFAGAGGCAVWGHESAHLLYRQGSQTLSVFSIPAADFEMAGKDGDYNGASGTHQLAAFVKNGGLYCVVINSPHGGISAVQTRGLRDQLRDSFTQTAISAATDPESTNLVSIAR
jgi:hypothetical protein